VRASTGDTGDRPFFFLSYAHSHRHDGLDPDDPDQLIGRLFKRLHLMQSPRDWNPYAPDSVEPLAEHAVVLARRDGFRSEVCDLYEQAAVKDAMRHAARQYLKYAPGHPPGSSTQATSSPPEPADG
jgi:hypothetical protein